MSDQTPYTPTLDAVANAYSYAMAELAGYDVDDYTDVPEFDRFIAKVKRDAALTLAEHFSAEAIDQARQGNTDGADFYRAVAAEIEKQIPEESP